MTTVKQEWGLSCPKCGCDDKLSVNMETTAQLTPKGVQYDDGLDGYWDCDSACFCGRCDHEGRVKDFDIDRPEHPAHSESRNA